MFIANGTINYTGDTVFGNSGFTVRKVGTGVYILTHNLGTQEFSVSTSQKSEGDQTPPIHINHVKENDNEVWFYTRLTSTLADHATAFDFTFISFDFGIPPTPPGGLKVQSN